MDKEKVLKRILDFVLPTFLIPCLVSYSLDHLQLISVEYLILWFLLRAHKSFSLQ